MNALIIMAFVSTAHAGLWAKFCEALIQDDPYQFETVSDEWIASQTERLLIKSRWGTLQPSEVRELQLLDRETERRKALAKYLDDNK